VAERSPAPTTPFELYVAVALVNSATADQERQSSAALAPDGSMTPQGVAPSAWLLSDGEE
jgi:hypothetical protein